MNKSIPYAISGVGILVLLLSFPQVLALLKISLTLSKTTELIVMVAGAALVAAGVFLLSKSSKPEQPKEVPIYEGTGKHRKVVALQRMGKE